MQQFCNLFVSGDELQGEKTNKPLCWYIWEIKAADSESAVYEKLQ